MVENCALVRGTLAAWSEAVPTLQMQYWYSMPGMAMPSYCRLPLYDFCPWFARQPSQGNIVCFARIVALPAETAAEKQHYPRIGLQLLLAILLVVGRAVVYVISFATFRSEYTWTGVIDWLPEWILLLCLAGITAYLQV